MNSWDPIGQESFQIISQGGREVQLVATVVRESDRLCMQEEPFQAEFPGSSIGLFVAISLVGTIDLQIAGHAIFTKCGVVGSGVKAALLGPLAVTPVWQRRGIGSAIVRAGLKRLEDADVNLVCVLGDPAYYGRLGFVPETLVEPPFRLPTE